MKSENTWNRIVCTLQRLRNEVFPICQHIHLKNIAFSYMHLLFKKSPMHPLRTYPISPVSLKPSRKPPQLKGWQQNPAKYKSMSGTSLWFRPKMLWYITKSVPKFAFIVLRTLALLSQEKTCWYVVSDCSVPSFAQNAQDNNRQVLFGVLDIFQILSYHSTARFSFQNAKILYLRNVIMWKYCKAFPVQP
jgi:hypothetical protein